MVLDAAIIIIIAMSMVLGFRAGFVRTFLHVAGWILAVVLAFVWSPKVKELLMGKTDFYESMHLSLREKFAEMADPGQIASALPALLQKTVTDAFSQAQDMLSTTLAGLFFTILSFILVLAGIKFIFWVLTLLLTRSKEKGPAGIIDGILGSLAGLIKGLVLVFILLAVMVPVAGFLAPAWTNALSEWLDASYFAGTLYDNNLIVLVVRDFLS